MIINLTIFEFLEIVPKRMKVIDLLKEMRLWKKTNPNDFKMEVEV